MLARVGVTHRQRGRGRVRTRMGDGDQRGEGKRRRLRQGGGLARGLGLRGRAEGRRGGVGLEGGGGGEWGGAEGGARPHGRPLGNTRPARLRRLHHLLVLGASVLEPDLHLPGGRVVVSASLTLDHLSTYHYIPFFPLRIILKIVLEDIYISMVTYFLFAVS